MIMKHVSLRKGISLPVEMIVIIAIAVLVLVVIVTFFVGGAGSQIGLISDQDALARGCTSFAINYNCNVGRISEVQISGYKATCGGKTGNTLDIVCCKTGFPDLQRCAVDACRCSA